MKRAHLQIQRKLALPGPEGRRAPWVRLAQAAWRESRRAAGATFAGAPAAAPPRGAAAPLDELIYLRRACAAPEFPLEFASARRIAEAFLAALDAFLGAGVGPERREAWAELLGVAARAVLDLLDEARAAEASGHWSNRMRRD